MWQYAFGMECEPMVRQWSRRPHAEKCRFVAQSLTGLGNRPYLEVMRFYHAMLQLLRCHVKDSYPWEGNVLAVEAAAQR